MCGQLCSRLCAEGRDCAASATQGGPRARGAHDGGGTETLPSTARLLGGGLARSIRGTSDHQGWGWGGEAGRAGDEGPPQRQTPPPQPHRCARAQTQGAGNEPRNVAPCNVTKAHAGLGGDFHGTPARWQPRLYFPSEVSDFEHRRVTESSKCRGSFARDFFPPFFYPSATQTKNICFYDAPQPCKKIELSKGFRIVHILSREYRAHKSSGSTPLPFYIYRVHIYCACFFWHL